MTTLTVSERRRLLRIGRIARRFIWAAIALEWAAVVVCVVFGRPAQSVLFLLAALAFVALDVLYLGPLMHDATDAVARAAEAEAGLARTADEAPAGGEDR